MSLDNFEDAVAALERDGRSYVIAQFRTTGEDSNGETGPWIRTASASFDEVPDIEGAMICAVEECLDEEGEDDDQDQG